MQRTYEIHFKDPISQGEASKLLQPIVNFEYIEAIPKHELFWTPNDIAAQQYNIAQIMSEQAWDINNDASSIVIAITDDAVDLTHPDLAGNIWFNPGETPGNGIDDDGNGFLDDYYGWDFGDNDNDPNPPVSPLLDHGTHVAGCASAVTDNGTGIAAIGANARLMPIKIAQDATGSLTGGHQGIDYAIANGANVVNMSWGGGFFSQTYQDLFDIAYAEGVVCVAAAGNSNVNVPMYPASYNHVISVAATDQSDQKAVFSNFGTTVDVAAPGVSIYSTLTGSTSLYGNKSGTSMASPIVAGLVALMMDANPLATIDEIETCLTTTCDPVVGPFSGQCGGGRINAFEALKCITAPTADFTSNYTQVCPGQAVEFYNFSSGTGLTFNWSFPGGTPATSTQQNPIITYNTPGVYDVSLTVDDGFSTSSNTMTAYIVVAQPSAVISGNSSIISGGMGSVIVNFTGNPDYSITIFDGTTSYPISGITNNPYVHYFSPTTNTTYTLTDFSDSQCAGTFSGTAEITVNPVGSCDSTNAVMLKYLGTNLDDRSSGVEDIGDYGFLVFGRKNVSNSNFRNYVCRLDNCGNVIWEKLYNPTVYGIPVSAKMQNDTIVMCAYDGNSNSNARTIMVRLMLDGTVIDAHEYGPASNTTYPRYMEKAMDGTYVIGGVTNSTPSFGGNDQYVVRANSDGTIIWQTRIGGNANDFLHGIREDQYGNFLAVGYLRDYSSTRSAYITKLNSAGAQQWTRKYDMGSGYSYFNSILEHNGYYYAAGWTNTGTYGQEDGLLVKTDLDGNLIWSKKIGGTGYEQLSGIQSFGDTIYTLGVSSSGTSNREIVIIKVDTSGNMLDYTSFGTPSDDGLIGMGKHLEITDYGAVCGTAYGNGGYLGGDDILFFKYNVFSDNCDPASAVIQISDIALTEANFNLSQNYPNHAFSPDNWIPEDVVSAQGFICSDITPIDTNVCDINADFDFNSVFCIADSVQFNDLSTGVQNNVNVNLWDFGDGSAPQFAPAGSVVHLYPAPGNYTVQLIAIDTLVGCMDTISYPIQIVANPFIDLPDTVYLCPGEAYTVPVLSTCASDSATTDWYQDSLTIIEYADSALVSAINSQYLHVSITDFGTTIIDSVYLSVAPNCCVSDPIISASGIGACPGETIYFENSSIVSGSNPTFEWTISPDGSISNYTGLNPPGITFGSSGMKEIILQMTDSCGVFYDTLDLYIFDPPIFNMGQSDTYCQSTMLNLGEDPVDNWQYTWSPANVVSDPNIANPTAWITDDQTITVEVTDPWTGCTLFDTIHIAIDSIAFSFALSDTTLCLNEELFVQAPVDPAITSYLWNTGSTDSYITVTESGVYSVEVVTSCTNYTDSILVDYQVCDIYIPNILSLSSLEGNDLWFIESNALTDMNCLILNRWGNVIYELTDINDKWDGTSNGKLVSEGTYYYLMTGTTVFGDEVTKHGFIKVVH
jgi:gliding motility-associated-like protein